MLRAISLVWRSIPFTIPALAIDPALPPPSRDILAQRWPFIGLVTASWLLVDYFLVVALGSLEPAMFTSVAIVCCCAIIVYMRYGRAHSAPSRFDFGAEFCCFAVLGLLAASTLLVPLTAWDARTIWFLHAKMLYFTGGLIKEGGWTAPWWAFSHPDYPLLVPILAAQATSLAGFWNE